MFQTVINNNRACRALSGDIGTCLSYPECFAFRGNISGTCGTGYGLCCVSKLTDIFAIKFDLSHIRLHFPATKTCQGVIYANNTYFVNQGYPSSYTSAGQCYTTINRLTPNICQIRYFFNHNFYLIQLFLILFFRLDFEAFSISQPESVAHRCVTDSFVVTGTTSPVPVICGDNAGQHSMQISVDQLNFSWFVNHLQKFC